MKSFKDIVNEVAQPLSQGEQNFKKIHGELTPSNIQMDPKVLGQEHVFKGSKEQVSFNHTPDSDYDKDLKVKQDGIGITTESVEDIEEEYKDPDKHYDKQSQKMKDAINLHLRKGKTYWDAVRSAKVHVKEGWVALGPASKPGEKPKSPFNKLGGLQSGSKVYGDMPKQKASGRTHKGATDIASMRKEEVEAVEEAKKASFKDIMAKSAEKTKEKYKDWKPPHPVQDKTKVLRYSSDMKKEEVALDEKTLTPAEKAKREEIVKAMKRQGAAKDERTYAIATAQAKKVAEEVDITEDYDMDYEGEMAKAELNAICDKAGVLAEMLDNDTQLEAWLQSKITKAKYMIDSVYDYMMYSQPNVDPKPDQSSSMASNYDSFLNRMGGQ